MDGRLKVFHDIEKDIIRCQMEALRAQAPDSQRTAILMDEFQQVFSFGRCCCCHSGVL